MFDDDRDVLLQKQKMFVVKDKHIIMQVTRNSNDGLWDIPIYKTKLQHNNFPAQTTHAAIYQKRVKNDHTIHVKKSEKSVTNNVMLQNNYPAKTTHAAIHITKSEKA